MAFKKKLPIIGGVSIQLIILFAYIHHQNRLVQLQYQKQKLEEYRDQRAHTITRLQNRLHRLHNLSSIEERARTELGMQPMNTRSIKKLDIT